jgi:putative transposase
MPFVSKRPKIQLSNEEIDFLTSLSNSRTAPAREIERAKIILLSYRGCPIIP